MSTARANWYRVANADEIPSPALLVFPDRIETNIRRMLAIAGGPQRLFPHVKTHKLPEVVRMEQAAGIDKFKCATIAEAEMAAGCSAGRVLLAYQPVGPNIRRLLELAARFPETRFSALVDNLATLGEIAQAAQAKSATLELLLDVDCGMHRTGIAVGPGAVEVYRAMSRTPGVSAGGIHAYDGHVHDADAGVRQRAAEGGMQPVRELRSALEREGLRVPRLVVGGTPTFPVHAQATDVECSPGTCLLMDATYAALLPECEFVPAAVVLTRVISKPAANRLCLDLGHKAIASENPHPRVQLFGLTDAAAVGHSEEHLVLETPRAAEFKVGDVLYGIPRHICPTVALHAAVVVVKEGRAIDRWRVIARDRMLTI